MKIKKAILTGGGKATRLRPVTLSINKHLIPLANKPMIFHAIEKVVEAGVEEIFINTNPGETHLQSVVGDGGHWGVKIKFFEQEGGPQGVAHVVKQAERFIGDDPFLFYLSDNIILGSLKNLVKEFSKNNYDCLLAISEVSDPERFGVPVFDKEGKLADVVEKPSEAPSNFAVTGIYLYGPKVFFEAFKNIQKSNRGEYEISSINSYILKNNYNVGCKEITGFWKDTGKPDDLILANELLLNELPKETFKREGWIEEGAEIEGYVRIGVGTTLNKHVKIKGPVIIGENCTLENCFINSNTTIGAGCVVNGSEIGRSIILNNCNITASAKIYNSILGSGVTIRGNKDGLHKLILGDSTLMEI